MSRRQDLREARARRERIRKEKHAQRTPNDLPPGARPRGDPMPAYPLHPFASERSSREIHALLEGHECDSVEALNAKLAELTQGGRISEMAQAWKQDDPKWRAQNLAYDALETDDIEEALHLVKDALDLDPDCTDARRLMVSLAPVDLDHKIHLMREVVEKAERNLGEVYFEENLSHFWGLIETRPYMRAKLHLGELLQEQGKLAEAATVFDRMLELNKQDNLGVRDLLRGVGLALGDLERVNRVQSEYPEEEYLAVAAWTRVMERFLAGDEAGAGKALSRARKINRFAEPYLSGAREAGAPPDYFKPGDESEALVCAQALAPACVRHTAFQAWLLNRPR